MQSFASVAAAARTRCPSRFSSKVSSLSSPTLAVRKLIPAVVTTTWRMPFHSHLSLIAICGVLISLQLLPATCSAAEPIKLQRLVRAPRRARVPSSYFVHIRDHVSVERMQQFVTELEEGTKDGGFDHEVKLQGLVSQAGHGFSVYLSKAALKKVRESNIVAFVEEDHIVKAGHSNTRLVSTWGLDRLDQPSPSRDYQYTPPCNLTGRGVDVYVLDSGIQYTHRSFGGRAVYPGCDPIDQLEKTNRSGSDCTGHGTHVAGTIGSDEYGVAPGTTIFSVRVLNCQNVGTFNTIVLGVECVLKKVKQRKRPAIVNLSLYGAKNFATKRAMDSLLRNGITVVTIAGNNPNRPRDACKVSPASVHGLITVSASTKTDQGYFQTNMGVCVDLYAPGIEIQSTALCDNCRSMRSGSSMAAPHVAGAIALLMEKCPHITPWRVRHILLSQMVAPNKLDFSNLPKKFIPVTPNLLLQTSSLECNSTC